MAKEKSKKIRIQLLIDEEIAEKERRTKSAVVEMAILEYTAKSKGKSV
jgi:hypothetical protein